MMNFQIISVYWRIKIKIKFKSWFFTKVLLLLRMIKLNQGLHRFFYLFYWNIFNFSFNLFWLLFFLFRFFLLYS